MFRVGITSAARTGRFHLFVVRKGPVARENRRKGVAAYASQ
jgi:hypothetical protein